MIALGGCGPDPDTCGVHTWKEGRNQMHVRNSVDKFEEGMAEGWVPTSVPPMQYARDTPMCVELNGDIYAIGGLGSKGAPATAEVLTAGADAWTVKQLDGGRQYGAAAVCGSRIWLVGGENCPHYVASYAAGLDDHRDEPVRIQEGRAFHAMVTLNSMLYVIGGKAGEKGQWKSARFLPTVLRFDPQQPASGWVAVACMNEPRAYLAAGVVDGYIYVVGGSPQQRVATATVERYDPTANAWEYVASMREPRKNHGVGVFNGKLYAVGGSTSRRTETVEVYDPTANVWMQAPSLSCVRSFVSVLTLSEQAAAGLSDALIQRGPAVAGSGEMHVMHPPPPSPQGLPFRSQPPKVQMDDGRGLQYVLILEGIHKHYVARVKSAQPHSGWVLAATLDGHDVRVRPSNIQLLPMGSRRAMQDLALGDGIGGSQASFVVIEGRVRAISLTPEYNPLLFSQMRVKASMDDEVLHGQVVFGARGQSLKRFLAGNGKTKAYEQKALLPFHEATPLLMKLRSAVFLYLGKWKLNGEYSVTNTEAEAGEAQNHEDFAALPTGYRTKHYQLVYCEGAAPASSSCASSSKEMLAVPAANATVPAAKPSGKRPLSSPVDSREFAPELGNSLGTTALQSRPPPPPPPPLCAPPRPSQNNQSSRKRPLPQPGVAPAAAAAVPPSLSASDCPLLCPISLEHMEEPVSLPCGHNFERKELLVFLKASKTCPVCRSVMPRGELKLGINTFIRNMCRLKQGCTCPP